VYLDLYDRQAALAIAQDAVRLFPKDLEARKLFDRIEASPYRAPPTFVDTNPEALVTIGVVALFVGGILAVMSIFGAKTEGVSFLVLLCGGGLWLFGRSREKKKLLERAMADQIRKQRS